MTKKKRASKKQTNIKVGNISDVNGEVNIADRDIDIRNTTTGLSAAEINQLFNQVYSAIDTCEKTPLLIKLI